MKSKILFLATASIVCTGLLFTSCKKKEAEDNDTEGAGDHSMAETYSNDVVNIGNQASYGQGSYSNNGTYREGPEQVYTTCATLTFDTLNHADSGDSLTVDFGSSGCVGKDGRSRKGKLLFIHTPGLHYRDSGNVINVSTPGNTYYVDANQVIINSKTITNKGHINGNLNWVVTANMQVNRSNGNVVTWSTSKTKVLLAGEMPNNQPIDWPHAKIAVYGSANGTHTKSGGNSQSFSVNVQQSKWLVRDFNCSGMRRFFVQGILEFTPGNKPTRYVDFGTGNCDDQATVTINGHVYNVTLH